LSIQAFIESITERGYAVLPKQVEPQHLAELNTAADRAVAALDRAVSAGVKPAHTPLLSPYYRAVRCFYTWDRACRRMLEHETVAELGQALLGDARLWDMEVLEARPVPPAEGGGPLEWHRDFPVSTDTAGQGYLWLFVCLTDTNESNGATWVVPGSHRQDIQITAEVVEQRIAVNARAGDIVALNPVAIHSVGTNRTDSPRRLALIGLCRAGRSPVLNHWAIAGRDIQRAASDRLRGLLHSNDWSLDDTWDVLPEPRPQGTGTRVLRQVLRSPYVRKARALTQPGRLWVRLRKNA
jgi:hypothetical protein